MAWAKFDDRWATHPKLLAAGLEAKGLDASGICYAAGQETDGFVPDTALVILGAGHRNPRKVADRLVEVGRWIRDDRRKGYVIHDFDRYNFTRAQGEAKRSKAAERKAAYRAKQGRDERGRITSGANGVPPDDDECPEGQEDVSPWDNEGRPTGTTGGVPPVPTRPDPTRTNRSSSSNGSAEPAAAEEEEPDFVVSRAIRIAAERRLASRTAGQAPVVDRESWLAKTVSTIRLQLGDALAELAAQGADVDGLVAAINPPPIRPASPYPAAGQQPEPTYDEVLVDGEWKLVSRVGA